jgi:hypothetical protein
METPDIIQVSWGKTVNIGNFETVRLDLTARVNEGQDWQEVLKALRILVRERELAIKAKLRPPQED